MKILPNQNTRIKSFKDILESETSGDIIFSCPPEIINKKWGYEKVIVNRAGFCGKILHYNHKGSISSFHMHLIKQEHFTCISGSFIFRYKDDKGNTLETTIKKDDAIFIPKCAPHQLESLEDNSEILEISTFHSDLDVIRIEPGDSQRR